MADVKHVSDSDFKTEVEEAKGLVLVDFWGTGCGPCEALAPVIEEVAKELGDKVKVCKANVDESRNVAIGLDIMTVPTLVLYKNGKVMENDPVIRAKADIVAMINKHLA